MTGKLLSKAVFDHSISTNILKRLASIIANHKCIFKSANIGFLDTVVVLIIELHNLSPIVIPVRKNQMIGRSNKYNIVASINIETYLPYGSALGSDIYLVFAITPFTCYLTTGIPFSSQTVSRLALTCCI